MNKKKCLTMMLAFLALGMTGLEAQKAMPLKVEAKAVAVSAAGDKAKQAEAVLPTDGTVSRQRLDLGNPSAPAVAFDKLTVAPQAEAVQHTDKTVTHQRLNLGNPSAPTVALGKLPVAPQARARTAARATTRAGEDFNLVVMDKSPNVPSTIKQNEDGQLEVTLFNIGSTAFEDSVYMVLTKDGSTIEYNTNGVNVTVPASGEATVQIPYNVGNLTRGDYYLLICYVGNDDLFYPIYFEDGSSNRIVSVEGAILTVLDKSPNIPSTITQHQDGQLEVTIGNTGVAAFKGDVAMMLLDNDGNNVYNTSVVNATIPVSGEATVQIPYNVSDLATDTYYLAIGYVVGNTLYFIPDEEGNTRRSVSVVSNLTVLDKSPNIPSTINQHEEGLLEVTIGNTGSTALEYGVAMLLEGNNYYLYSITVNATIPASGEATVQIPYNVGDLAPGTYDLTIGYVVGGYFNYILNEDGSYYRSVSVVQQEGSDLSLVMAESTFPETVVAQGEFTVQATITNAGADFDRPLSVAFADSEGNIVYETEAVPTTIVRGDTVQLTFKDTCDMDMEVPEEYYYVYVTYLTGGRYSVVAPDKGNVPQVTVARNPATHPVLTLVYDESELPDSLRADADTLTVCLQNTGGADFNGELCVFLQNEDFELMYSSIYVAARVPQGGGKVMVDIPYDLSEVLAGRYVLRVAEVYGNTMYPISAEDGYSGFWIDVWGGSQFALRSLRSSSLQIGSEGTAEFELRNITVSAFSGEFFFVLYDEAGRILYVSEPDSCTCGEYAYSYVTLTDSLPYTLKSGTYPIGVGYLVDGDVQMIPLAEDQERPTVQINSRFEQSYACDGALVIGADATVEVGLLDNGEGDLLAEEFYLLLLDEDSTTVWQSEPMQAEDEDEWSGTATFTCNVGTEIAKGTYYWRLALRIGDGMQLIPFTEDLEAAIEQDPSQRPTIEVLPRFEQGSGRDGELFIGMDNEVRLEIRNNGDDDLSAEEFYLLLLDRKGTTVAQSGPMKVERIEYEQFVFTCNVGIEIEQGTYYWRMALRTEDGMQLIPLTEELEEEGLWPVIEVRYRFQQGTSVGGTLVIGENASVVVDIQDNDWDAENNTEEFCLLLLNEEDSTIWQSEPMNEGGIFTCNVGTEIARGRYYVRVGHCTEDGMYIIPWQDGRDEEFEEDPTRRPTIDVCYPIEQGNERSGMLLIGEDTKVELEIWYYDEDILSTEEFYLLLQDEEGSTVWQSEPMKGEKEDEWSSWTTFTCNVDTETARGTYYWRIALRTEDGMQLIPFDAELEEAVEQDPSRRPTIDVRYRFEWNMGDGNLLTIAQGGSDEISIQLRNYGETYNGSMYLQLCDEDGAVKYTGSPQQVEVGSSTYLYYTLNVPATWAVGTYQLRLAYVSGGLKYAGYYDENDEGAVPQVEVFDPSLPMLIGGRMLLNGGYEDEIIPGQDYYVGIDLYNSGAAYNGNVCMVLSDEAGTIHYQTRSKPADVRSEGYFSDTIHFVVGTDVMPGVYRMNAAYPSDGELQIIPNDDNATVEVLDPNVPRLRLNSLASDGLLAPDADFELEANLVNRGGDFNGGLYIQMLDTYGEPVYQSPATNVQLQRGATAQVTLTGHVAAATALGDYQLCVIYDPDGGSDLERIPFVDEYEEYPWVRVIDPSVPLLNLSYLMSGDGTTEYQPGASMMMLAGVTNVFDGNVGVNLFLVLYDQAGRMVYQNEAQWVEIQAGSSPDLLFLGTLDASITPGTYRLAIAYEVGTQLHDIPLADGSGTGIEITVLGEGTGLGMNSEAGFTCYPNPATTHVNIRAEGGMERVLLHSLSGMLLMDEDGHGEAAYRLDLDRLPQGTYLLTVETPDATYTQRIIKE